MTKICCCEPANKYVPCNIRTLRQSLRCYETARLAVQRGVCVCLASPKLHGLGEAFVWGGKQETHRQQHGDYSDETDNFDGRVCGHFGFCTIRTRAGILSSTLRSIGAAIFRFSTGNEQSLGRMVGRIVEGDLPTRHGIRRLRRTPARVVRLGDEAACR